MIVEKKPGIYLIFCLANQRVYIGQSKNVKARLGGHQSSLKSNKHNNDYLQKAYNKYGVDMFVFRPCEYPEDTSIENLTLREQYWIEQFDAMNPRRGFNMMEAGPAGSPGEETRKKMSEAQKGRVHTEETRQRISKGNKGLRRSEETKEKISEARTGIEFSEETKARMSEARKGKVASEETRRKISEFQKNRKRGPMSEEARAKMSEAAKRRSSSNSQGIY
jgi:group I intron endonuclease